MKLNVQLLLLLLLNIVSCYSGLPSRSKTIADNNILKDILKKLTDKHNFFTEDDFFQLFRVIIMNVICINSRLKQVGYKLCKAKPMISTLVLLMFYGQIILGHIFKDCPSIYG